jgi:AraC family transcriptional regulator of adaptative response / DNA-3-methyladenine glycosylase II
MEQELGWTDHSLAFETPFDWHSLVDYLKLRTAGDAEQISDGTYRRSVSLGNHRGWIEVCRDNDAPRLMLKVSDELLPVIPAIKERMRRLFDLDADPILISSHLKELSLPRPGLRLPGAFDPFELSVRAILGQLVSVKGACRLMSRYVTAFGEPFDTPFRNINRLTPTAEQIAKATPADIALSVGIPKTRARAIWYLADAISNRSLDLESKTDVRNTIIKLKEIPGIGDWTAHYVAMHGLSWSDAFLHGDLALRKILNKKTDTAMLAHAEPWSPWRAYAVMHLWQSITS